jgi:hypothetical protein
MSPGRVLVAGTGRVAAGTGRLGEPPLDSRCGEALEFGEKDFAIPTHNIMSRIYNQNASVKKNITNNHARINRWGKKTDSIRRDLNPMLNRIEEP